MFNTTPHNDIPPSTAPSDTEPIEPQPRRSFRWQCPECDNSIMLHVRVRHAPICNNKAAHSRRHIDMKRTRNEDK